MVRVQFCCFKPCWQWYCTYHSKLRHHVCSLKGQWNKLNKSKKWAFLSQPFLCNKKTSCCSISDGGAGDVGVVAVSTDIQVDNVVDNNVTEVTNYLDNKNFSRLLILEVQILVLKNSLSEENAERLSLAIELMQLKTNFNNVNTELKIKTGRLAKLCAHNFNKRINQQKQINKELSSKITLLSCAVSNLEKENVKLKKDLNSACMEG